TKRSVCILRDRNTEPAWTHPPGSKSGPTQLFHGYSGMPDLRHVSNLVTIKLHHIDIVAFHALPCGWAGTAVSSMRCEKDAVCADALSGVVGSKRFQFISSVRHETQQRFHPVGIFPQGFYTGKGFGLRRKCRIGFAVRFAAVPSLTRFAGLEELFRSLCNRHRRFLLSLTA